MKRLATIILTILLVLSIVGCANNNETNGSDTSVSPPDATEDTSTDDPDQSKETENSHDNVPGTNVSVYPGSQQVYSSKDEIVYATTDSGNEVYEFYKNHPDLKRLPGSGSVQEGAYGYTTPLTDLLRGMGTDQDKLQEKIDEINAYINESGGLTGLVIYDVNVDAQYKENQFGSIFSELPTDKTLIRYALIAEQ